jgi:hypothetical protein
MSREIVSTVAEQLSAPSQQSVERALSLVMADAGAARVSLAVFSSSRVELVSSCGRALLANGAQVPFDASSMFAATARRTVFWERDIGGLADFGRPVDRLMLASGFRSACSIPVMRGREALGALSVSHPVRHPAAGGIGELRTLSAVLPVVLGVGRRGGRPGADLPRQQPDRLKSRGCSNIHAGPGDSDLRPAGGDADGRRVRRGRQ